MDLGKTKQPLPHHFKTVATFNQFRKCMFTPMYNILSWCCLHPSKKVLEYGIKIGWVSKDGGMILHQASNKDLVILKTQHYLAC